MIHSNPLLNCQSIQQLDQLIGELPNCRSVIGPWGGRKFTTVTQNPPLSFSLNQLVSQLILLAEKPAEEAERIRSLIRKIRILDSIPDPKVSILRRICTAVRRFFGNFFFNRNVALEKLEQKLPPLQPPQEKPPETIPVKPFEPFIEKPYEPIQLPAHQPPLFPSKSKNPLKAWLMNPVESPKTTAFFMNIKGVISSPYSEPNETIEGLLKQCTDDGKVNLQNAESLLLIEGIFSHCIVDKIVTQYTANRIINIFEWLSKQSTWNDKTLDAAIKGHLAHRTPSFSSLFDLVKCIQTLRMKEAPASLGRALAKMVQLDANSNPFEQLFRNLLKNDLIQNEDYLLILKEFRIKRGDPDKVGCTWKILDELQEHAKAKGWQ